MIKSIIKFFRKVRTMAEEARRNEEEMEQIRRDNLKIWNEMHKDFIEEMNRKTDKEIDEYCDVSRVLEHSGYTRDGRPLKR